MTGRSHDVTTRLAQTRDQLDKKFTSKGPIRTSKKFVCLDKFSVNTNASQVRIVNSIIFPDIFPDHIKTL